MNSKEKLENLAKNATTLVDYENLSSEIAKQFKKGSRERKAFRNIQRLLKLCTSIQKKQTEIQKYAEKAARIFSEK